MTIEQFEVQVLRLIGKADPQFKVDGREVLALANQAIATFVKRRGEADIPISFYSTFERTIKGGQVTIPFQNLGNTTIYSIVTDSEIIPYLSSKSEAIMFSSVDDSPKAWIEGSKVVFDGVQDQKVTILAIPNLLEMDDDEVMVGGEYQRDIIALIFEALRLKLAMPEDRANNG